jgi:hypothetical protein
LRCYYSNFTTKVTKTQHNYKQHDYKQQGSRHLVRGKENFYFYVDSVTILILKFIIKDIVNFFLK